MTGLMPNPQCSIVHKVLRDLSLVAEASSTSGTNGSSTDWPAFIANMPDTPDNCVAIFDTEGIRNGRSMVDGEVYKRPGFQIRVRSSNYLFGHEQIDTITTNLSESVQFRSVTLAGGNVYRITGASIASGPQFIGKETEVSQRYLFTVNGTLSITKE